jgi:hypothetical protein
MNGAVRLVTSREYDPSDLIGVEISFAGFEESFRYTVPLIGVPVAATPETVWGVLVVLPPPLQPAIIVIISNTKTDLKNFI